MQETTWSTPFDRSLSIFGGRVRCPDRADVDVETCLACAYLLGIEGVGAARIICSWPVEVADRVVDELEHGRRWGRRRQALR